MRPVLLVLRHWLLPSNYLHWACTGVQLWIRGLAAAKLGRAHEIILEYSACRLVVGYARRAAGNAVCARGDDSLGCVDTIFGL